jgi:hypothetical protein
VGAIISTFSSRRRHAPVVFHRTSPRPNRHS